MLVQVYSNWVRGVNALISEPSDFLYNNGILVRVTVAIYGIVENTVLFDKQARTPYKANQHLYQ